MTLTGHDGVVNSVVYSADGQWIVTASFDQTAKVWDTKRGKELLTLTGHDDGVKSAMYSPDSSCIVTTGWSKGKGEAKVWQAKTGQELMT